VQITGYREPAGLDRKPERANLRMSAHAVVQEYINLTDQLYGIVTNGRLLRLLRDSSRLIKLSYLEFDLDRIFTDGLFADFAVLYRLLHASRLPASNEAGAESWIELYHQDSLDSGARIREGLSRAIEQAIRRRGVKAVLLDVDVIRVAGRQEAGGAVHRLAGRRAGVAASEDVASGRAPGASAARPPAWSHRLQSTCSSRGRAESKSSSPCMVVDARWLKTT